LKNRYSRNETTLSAEENRLLREKKVCVAGCGGLGGYLIEMLMRLGVGHITAVDPDVFEDTNLNRQLLCEEPLLGYPKARAAADRADRVNSDVRVTALQERLTGENALEICGGHDVILDALDSIPDRLMLQDAAEQLGIPLIHGAIAGWYGQVAVVFPGDRLLERIYPSGERSGAERELGNPSFTPALVASLQISEAVKVLAGRGTLLRGKILYADLLENRFHTIETG